MRLREGNKEKDIMDAAIKIFADKGFFKSKIHAIAENAGIATGSVYLYYKNKEHILEKIFEMVWKDLFTEVSSLHQREDIDPLVKLEMLFDRYFSIFIKNTNLAKVFVQEIEHRFKKGSETYLFYELFFETAEKIVRQGMDLGMVNKDIDPKVLRYFILGGVRSLLAQWAVNHKQMKLETVKQNLILIVLNGIRTR